MTVTTLKNRPDLKDKAIKLIETALGYKDGHSFNVDFAPLMNNNDDHLYIIEENNEVLAHIGFKKRILVINNNEFSFGLLGGIAVDKKQRGKGLFRTLINEVINRHNNEVCMFLLWSDLIDLYNKFDFHLGIGQLQNTSAKKNHLYNDELYEEVIFNELSSSEKQEIKNLYNESAILSFKRTEQDWKNIEAITSANLFIRKDQEKIVSYFFQNKGADLKNIIHEFNAQADIRFALLNHLKDYPLWLPESDEIRDLTLCYMGMHRLGNPKLFKNFINKYSKGKVDLVTVNKEKISFTFEDKTYNCEYKEFINYLFGPGILEEFKDDRYFLYISGSDSI